MTKEEGLDLISKLYIAFGKKYDELQAILYLQYLGKYSYEQAKRVVDAIITTPGQFMPTIGDLIGMLDPLDVGKAWQRVLDVARGGCRSWPRLSDAEIATISAIGGMFQIQDATDESLHFICNDFKRTYPIMVRREIKYLSDEERLKDLNMVPETYLFIKKSTEAKELKETPDVLMPMLHKIGKEIK